MSQQRIPPPPLRPIAASRLAGMSAFQIAATAAVGLGVFVYYKANGPPVTGRPVFSKFGFHKLKLQSTELINHNTKRLRFELPDPTQPSGLTLSSALLTFGFPSGGWKPRPYTPVNDLDEQGFIDLIVKHYPNGPQSTYIHSLQPGDRLLFAPIPKPTFAYKSNANPHLTLIAGGAGITPMYQLARGILKNPSDKTRISIVWGVNEDQDIFLKDEFAALQKQHPDQFRVTYVVATPEKGSKHLKGFVTKEVLEKVGGVRPGETKVLVCGPPPMEAALKGGKGKKGVLGELGFGAKEVHSF